MSSYELFERCKSLRSIWKFKPGDNCWLDPEGPNAKEENTWITEEWVLNRGPEWVVREVGLDGVWISYKIDHVPTFASFEDVVPYIHNSIRLCPCGMDANKAWEIDPLLMGCPKCGAVWPESLRGVE